MIYLDHAATSWPKPEAVLRAAEESVRFAGGNPSRGTHPLAEERLANLIRQNPEKAAAWGITRGP